MCLGGHEDPFGRKGETEAQQGSQRGLTVPWLPPATRTPGGERGAERVITFRSLMSRPELVGPLGLPGDGERGRRIRKEGARAHRGEKWGEVACGF